MFAYCILKRNNTLLDRSMSCHYGPITTSLKIHDKILRFKDRARRKSYRDEIS